MLWHRETHINPQRNRWIIVDQAGIELTTSRLRQLRQLPVVQHVRFTPLISRQKTQLQWRARGCTGQLTTCLECTWWQYICRPTLHRLIVCSSWWCHQMVTFSVTGHLCGEFIGHRWIPRTKASDAELWFFLSTPERLSKQWWGSWLDQCWYVIVLIMTPQYCSWCLLVRVTLNCGILISINDGWRCKLYEVTTLAVEFW